jgi:hypothetical protein
MPDDVKQRWIEIFQVMQKARPETSYYAITLTAKEDDQLVWQAQTGFAGYTEAPNQPPREIRKACLVKGQLMLDNWRRIGRPGLSVHNTQEWFIYMHFGGNAIIEDQFSKEFLPHIHQEQTVVPTGLMRWKPIESTPSQALRHAPNPKLRMKILKRDNYKCRVCGRSPNTNVDIELHVHHFCPWSQGGLTEESNLITLCHTCHKGLDPHYDVLLANIFQETFAPLRDFQSKSDERQREYHLGIQRYRTLIRKLGTAYLKGDY